MHGGKSILMPTAVAALADPVCRGELDRYSAGEGDAAELVRHLADTGPSELEDVKLELGWSSPRMRRARTPLERSGALVSQSVTLPLQGGWSHPFEPPSPLGPGVPRAGAGRRCR